MLTELQVSCFGQVETSCVEGRTLAFGLLLLVVAGLFVAGLIAFLAASTCVVAVRVKSILQVMAAAPVGLLRSGPSSPKALFCCATAAP